jgi:hypothetical protein
MINRVMGNEIIRGKLLSTDGELTLVVLALDPASAGIAMLLLTRRGLSLSHFRSADCS